MCLGMLASSGDIEVDTRAGIHVEGRVVARTLHRELSQVEKGQEVTIQSGTRSTYYKD